MSYDGYSRPGELLFKDMRLDARLIPITIGLNPTPSLLWPPSFLEASNFVVRAQAFICLHLSGPARPRLLSPHTGGVKQNHPLHVSWPFPHFPSIFGDVPNTLILMSLAGLFAPTFLR